MYRLLWRTRTGTSDLGEHATMDEARQVAVEHSRIPLIWRKYDLLQLAEGINETVYEIKPITHSS